MSASVTVYVNVLDVNDNAPVFTSGGAGGGVTSSYVGSVWEDAVVGTSVLTVNAKDADSGLGHEIIDFTEYLLCAKY